MTQNDFLDLGFKVLGAAIGIFVVARILSGVVGEVLEYGATLAAIAGLLCLALGILRGR